MKHKVDMEASVFQLTKAGTAVTFKIFNEEGKLGEIKVGKGSFWWKAAGKKDFQDMNWTSFCNKLNDIFYNN
jgi:hypothetical protein